MMGDCYIIARGGISGGTASLAFRLLTSLKDSGLNVIYSCFNNNDSNNMLLFEREGIEVVYRNDKTFEKHFLSVKDRFSNFKFIVFSPEEYLMVEKLSLRYSQIDGCLYYVVHDYAFCRPGSSRIIQLLSKYRYRSFVRKLYENGAIIFMSKICLRNACDLLKLNLPNSDEYVFNLPIRIKEWDDADINAIRKHTPFTITTITRMDFPFKGYVLGLLGWFTLNAEKYNLQLTIIGEGSDSGELMAVMNNMSDNLLSRITYIKNVPYNQLCSVFFKTDLYIGMGTTLIDAANDLTIAIPVKAYTRELLVDGLFSDNIDSILAEQGSGDFDELFMKVYSSSEDEFVNFIKHQYTMLKSAYDIQKMTHFVSNTSYKKHVIGFFQMLYMNSINRLSAIFHKSSN